MGDDEARPFSAFRDEGLLWLINTTVFHHRGYALSFHYADDADPMTDEPIGWSLMGDGNEVWVFSDPPNNPGYLDEMFARVKVLLDG